MNLSIVINTRNRKQMLYALIESILMCRGSEGFEIIVVDDFSDEDYSEEIYHKYPFVKFVRNISRQYLIESRNTGWKLAKNKWVFFIDDDNEIFDPEFFAKAEEAVKVCSKTEGAGVIGARTYYFSKPDIIMVGPSRFSLLTGRTVFLGSGMRDDDLRAKILDGVWDKKGTAEGYTEDCIGSCVETHDAPNAFFVSRAVLQKTGGFSGDIVQTFSEADFAQKVRKLGLKVYHCSGLKVYHKSDPPDFSKLGVRQMGGSPERFYFLMRNRFVFIKRWGSFFHKFMFTFVFSHFITLYYLVSLVRLKEYEMVRSGLRGLWNGYVFMFTGRLRNFYLKRGDR